MGGVLGRVGGGGVRRLPHIFFFRILIKIDTIFLRVFKAYFSLTKTFYVGYPCGSVLKTGFLAVLRLDFDGSLCQNEKKI